MPPTNSRSYLPFFRYLPSEIVTDILSRLPIRTIVTCKCVCRSWRDLLRTREFADFHFAKSVPGLVIAEGLFDFGPDGVEVYEFVDELRLEHHDLHYKLLTKLDSMAFLRTSVLHGSANGLVLLHKEFSGTRNALYVCNPITREYIKLWYDKLVSRSTANALSFTFGFGVSGITGQHKVVRILIRHHGCANELRDVTMSICLVYTLGTGIWRSVAVPAPFLIDRDSIGVCLNGYLHWMARLLDDSYVIYRFDLEAETFSTLSLPWSETEGCDLGLAVLGDCLCVADNIEIPTGVAHEDTDHEIVIWLMKEYGDVKSWTKEFVLRPTNYDYDIFESSGVSPIKVFKDGDILMVVQNMYMFYHDNKTKAIEQCELFGYHEFEIIRAMKATLHTSSFFSLGSFVNERVHRF